MLQLLLSKLLFYVEAKWHRALVLLTVLGMIAAQSNELLTDGTATIRFPLAALCVLHHTLHLLARWQGAVGIATLTGVDQRLNAALNAETAGIARVLRRCCCLVATLVIETQTKLLHSVLMTLSFIASDAKVIVLTDGAVKACLYVMFALVAGVDKAILALVVQFHQHTHRAPLGSSQRAELQVLVTSQCQKGIPPIHQIACHQRVWFYNGW